ncbi:MAG TPA: acyltransferase family protein [Anaerolineae bacterium]|nr:acyltransferase family protein [Anaerolineae bacterium]
MNGWSFRPDIEGLRAVAILLVVSAHAGLPGLAGGFIGVDVFFVLSGYLITGLLVTEHAATGRIGMLAFYARRFRRLLPALAIMLVVTAWLAWQLMVPGRIPEQAVSGAAASWWLSNLHYAFAQLDYFQPDQASNLYLHTWSLGVEEQFYLVWPAMLSLLLGARAWGLPGLKAALFGLLLLSLLACLWFTQSSSMLAFYLTPLRAWQFAAGALVFLLAPGPRSTVGTPAPTPWSAATVRIPMAGLGLTLVLVAAMLLDEHTPYPGMWALVPTLGTALVLAVAPRRSPTGRLLAAPPMQFLGRISYAWYLWHWPLLVLGSEVFDTERTGVRLGLVLAALPLAWLSLRFVEAPVRSSRLVARYPGATVVASLGLMIALAWMFLAIQSRAMNDSLSWSGAHGEVTSPVIYEMGCDEWYHSDTLRPCFFEGEGEAGATILLVGDSVGLQWFPAFHAIVQSAGWRLIVLTKSACPMVDEEIYYSRIGRDYVECSRWRERVLDNVGTFGADLVVVGSSGGYELDDERWREGSRRVLERLAASVPRVAVLAPTPVLPFHAPECESPRGWLHRLLASPERCSFRLERSRAPNVTRILEEAVRGMGSARVVDLNDAVCPQGSCRARVDGLLTFRDQQHLNGRFAESLSPLLAERLGLRWVETGEVRANE